MHRHTNTCSSNEKTCRFNYPRQVSSRTKFVDDNGYEIKDNQDLKKYSSRKIELIYRPHQECEFVNIYNPILLRCVRSNMDIQFCKSDWDTINYIVAYATKKEKELTQSLKALLENINSPVNYYTRDTLKALGNKFMNCRSISIQEAIMRSLPHLAMSNFSPQVMYIPSDMQEYRHGKLKSKKDLENLPDDSIDIFEKGIIDKYSNRPLSLHSLCYAEFAANYDPIPKHRKIIDSDPHKVIQLRNGLGNMMLRKFPKTVRTYTPSESKQPERFYYSKLCLYLPWVNELDILGIHSTYKESYHNEHVIKENIYRFEKFSDAYIDSLMDKIQHEISNKQNEKVNLRDDPSMLINKPSREITDIDTNIGFSYKESVIDNVEFTSMIESLNDEQRSVYKIVEQHCENLAAGKDTKQLLHFVSGPGGVGKSYLIKCIRIMINRKYDDGDVNSRVIVTASTGVAAANIDGLTIHQILQLDCQQSGYLNSKNLSEKKKQKHYLLLCGT